MFIESNNEAEYSLADSLFIDVDDAVKYALVGISDSANKSGFDGKIRIKDETGYEHKPYDPTNVFNRLKDGGAIIFGVDSTVNKGNYLATIFQHMFNVVNKDSRYYDKWVTVKGYAGQDTKNALISYADNNGISGYMRGDNPAFGATLFAHLEYDYNIALGMNGNQAQLIFDARRNELGLDRIDMSSRAPVNVYVGGLGSVIEESSLMFEGILKMSEIGNMTRQEIIDLFKVKGWDISQNNNYIHIRETAGGDIRVRLDPPDSVTDAHHVHLYDRNKNSVDKNLNVVDKKDSKAHIHYKGPGDDDPDGSGPRPMSDDEKLTAKRLNKANEANGNDRTVIRVDSTDEAGYKIYFEDSNNQVFEGRYNIRIINPYNENGEMYFLPTDPYMPSIKIPVMPRVPLPLPI